MDSETNPPKIGTVSSSSMELKTLTTDNSNGDIDPKIHEAVAMDCEMVGGGSDGTLNLCGRVCLIDENEDILFHAYVQPQIPITDYRSDVTGLSEEHLKDALPLKEVQEKILEILYNGESIGIARVNGGKARLLVGHSLEHDLDCLIMTYPDHLIRDTAKYHPLMKTNMVSHSLKYLTKMYLGYDIQMGVHDPYEDCVSVMRLYRECVAKIISKTLSEHAYLDLEKLTPDELYEMSRSKYHCWCLDSVLKVRP
ncbi:RNA exonuclease 4 [Bienertia sinuspersici]